MADQKNAAGTTTPALSETEKKVLDYIKKYESQKYSDAEIVKALEKSGIDQATIKKCMGLTKGKAPLYKNKWFLIGVGAVILLIVAVLAVTTLIKPECESDRDCSSGLVCQDNACVEEVLECRTDNDCGRGEECVRNDCVPVTVEEEVVVEEEEEVTHVAECSTDDGCQAAYGSLYTCEGGTCEKTLGAEAQCGDGRCDIGEAGSCDEDCPCAEDADCGDGYECNADGECEEESTGGGGGGDGDSGTSEEAATTAEAEPNIEVSSVSLSSLVASAATFSVTVENTGDATTGAAFNVACTLYDDTDTEIDSVEIEVAEIDDSDSSTETCEMDPYAIYDTLQTQDTMEVTLVASADIYDAISESDETDNNYTYTDNWTADDFGCESDSDCGTGYACDTSTAACSTSCTYGGDSSECASGYACASDNTCSEDADGDGIADVDQAECTTDDDCGFAESCVDSVCERTGVTGFRCSDNYDNDGDGLRDILDRGCTAPWDDDERNACLDEWDNDGDGLVDTDDDGCSSEADLTEDVVETECSDEWDNDGDGLTDLDDDDCDDADDDDERDDLEGVSYGAPAFFGAPLDRQDRGAKDDAAKLAYGRFLSFFDVFAK